MPSPKKKVSPKAKAVSTNKVKSGAESVSTDSKPEAEGLEVGANPTSSTKRMYKIRYGVIPASQISDSVIVANPEYGDRIGKWGSRPLAPNSHKMKRLGKFYQELEASIKKQGVRNPIFCNSYEEGCFCRYGTSRLWLAKKLKLDIPVIIADYVDAFKDLEELSTEEDILKKFKEKPEVLEITEEEMRFDGCQNID